MLINDREGGRGGPAREANAREGLVMFNQASEGPHGRGDIVADAVNEASAHGKEEGGSG